MRGVECVAPNCAHLHAETDESAAREFVQNGAYDDTQHATGASAN